MCLTAGRSNRPPRGSAYLFAGAPRIEAARAFWLRR